jgi:hypothetical protein
MTTMRRRSRNFDPLSTPEGVRNLLGQLRTILPSLIPPEEDRLISLLNAARYLNKRSNQRSQRGRPSQWAPEVLSEVITTLRKLLAEQTEGRISVQTFIGQHLAVLTYPTEIVYALAGGQINKQEAAFLARLTAARLDMTEEEARKLRLDLLKAHLGTHGSQNLLRNKVKEILGETTLFSRETLALGMQKSDALLELNRLDVKHMFFETMRDLFYAIRTLQPEELSNEDIAEFMKNADMLTNTLRGIELRSAKRRIHSKHIQDVRMDQESSQLLEIIKDPKTGKVTYKFR